MTNPFEGKTYDQAINLIAEQHGARDALVFHGRRFTFSDVKRHVHEASIRLASIGLRPGDTVALWMPNRPEFLWYWLGAARMGLVAVFMNTRLRQGEFMYQLSQSESRAVITAATPGHRKFLADLATAYPALAGQQAGCIDLPELPYLRHVICLDQPDALDQTVTDWSSPPSATSLPVAAAADPDKPAIIAYSSGTTALPKGAMLTHCVFRKAWDGGVLFDVTSEDALFLCVPLFGVLGFLSGVLLFWVNGCKVVLDDRFDAGRCLESLERESCTFFHMLPVMMEQILAHPDFRRRDISRLRAGVMLSNDPAVMRRAVNELGVRGATSGYGMTESTGLVTRGPWNAPLEERLKSHGKPLPGCAIRVVDPDTGLDMPTGEQGEIWIGGYGVMAGYFKKPEETRATITPDGWLRSGDLGYLNADGSLVFLHRLKDGYKHKGFNVSTPEVEARLLAHPDIREAAVVPIHHDTFGEVGIAFVACKDGQRPDKDSVMAYLKEHLSSFKVPADVIFIEEMPRTGGTEKIQKFKLRELALAQLTKDTRI